MEERKTTVEKHTEVTREPVKEPKTTNINIGKDGSTQVQEVTEVVEKPVSSTIIRTEETVEKQR
jgi:hypothetical protein